MIDLGAWLNEENTIPGVELPEDLVDAFRDEDSRPD